MKQIPLKTKLIAVITILTLTFGLGIYIQYANGQNNKTILRSLEINDQNLIQNTQDLSFLQTTNLIDEPDFPVSLTNKNQVNLSPKGEIQSYTDLSDKDDLEKNINKIIEPQQIIKPNTKTSFVKQAISEVDPLTNVLTGFISSSLPNNSINVDVNVEFTLNLPAIPVYEIVDKLGFYPKADFTISRNANQINVKAKRLKRSTQYVFGLKSQGICIGGSCSTNVGTWNYALRFTTNYKETYIYGESVERRNLVAYLYGNANENGKSVMLTAGVHGEEWRSGGTTNMVAFLDANPEEIVGQNKEIIIVPRVNPDGVQRNIDNVNATGNLYSSVGRNNSRNVNLNRNWPDVWLSCPSCGAFEASEPEVAALRDLTLSEDVTHLISYHAQWPANGMLFLGSDTSFLPTYNFASWVSQRSGYPIGVFDGPGSSDDFGYVPGDQSVWGEFHNIRSLIIEATYRPNSDYNSGTLEARLGAPNNYPLFLALLRDF